MQAFGQGSLAHQTAEGGTGLGLPIVQNLVTLHGGTFELRSELRKGTEAIVILPPSRVLRTMPPLQPLGQERHRQPAGGAACASSREPLWRSRANEAGGESTAVQLATAHALPSRRRASYIPAGARGLIPILRFCVDGSMETPCINVCVIDAARRPVRGLRPVARRDRALGDDDGRRAAAYHA